LSVKSRSCRIRLGKHRLASSAGPRSESESEKGFNGRSYGRFKDDLGSGTGKQPTKKDRKLNPPEQGTSEQETGYTMQVRDR